MRIKNGKIHIEDINKAVSKIVTAGISPILYHYTSINNAYDILNKGFFWLTPAVGTQSDHVPNSKLYFLSCSRIKHGGFARSKTYKCGVEFVLDGTMLAHNYSGSPVDYWGESWRNAVRNDKNSTLEDFLKSDENEDRVYSDKAKISSKYITEAHIFMADDIGEDRYKIYYPMITTIMRTCKTSDIEVYLYNQIQAFKTHNKAKAVPFSSLEKHVTKPEDFRVSRDWGRGDDVYTQIYYAKKYSELKGRARDMAWYLSSGSQGMRFEDYLRSLENTIHNSRSGGDNSKEGISKLLGLFKKNNCKTATDFLNVLAEKCKILVEEHEEEEKKKSSSLNEKI